MNILLIPLGTSDIRVTGEWLVSLPRVLSRNHRVVGPRLAPRFDIRNRFVRYSTRPGYMLKAFVFGLIHRGEFDVIVCMNSPYAFIGLGISLLTNRPMVWDCRDSQPIIGRQANKPKFYISMLFFLDKVLARFAKAVIMVSEEYKQVYVKEGFDPGKMAVIPHSLDLSVIAEIVDKKESLRKKLGLDIEGKIAMFTGLRAEPQNQKAIGWINEELAPAISQNSGDVKILITGSNPIPAEPHDSLLFPGFAPNIYEFIMASDIGIIPIWQDTTGPFSRILDFMACSKPTVVTNLALKGIPHLVDGENALIARTKEEFIQKVMNLLQNPDLAQKIGQNAGIMVRGYHSWDSWQQKLEEILSSCTQKSRPDVG